VRTRNFLELIKVLSENGYCTTREIAEKDSFAKGKIRKNSRQDGYYRLITGDKKKIPGLIQKGLIESKNPEWWKTKNNEFRLTLLGVLYSIRLFSKRPVNFSEVNIAIKAKQISKQRTIIDILSKNYSDVLPLVLKKQKFFEKDLPNIDKLLYFIAHHVPISTDLLHFPFFDTEPFEVRDFAEEFDSFQNEFTILFLGYLFIAMRYNHQRFRKIISKDKEIYDYYEKYLSILGKIQRKRQLDVKIVYYSLTGQYPKIENLRGKILDIKGRFSNSEMMELEMH
jgi:hypothetical protein